MSTHGPEPELYAAFRISLLPLQAFLLAREGRMIASLPAASSSCCSCGTLRVPRPRARISKTAGPQPLDPAAPVLPS